MKERREKREEGSKREWKGVFKYLSYRNGMSSVPGPSVTIGMNAIVNGCLTYPGLPHLASYVSWDQLEPPCDPEG